MTHRLHFEARTAEAAEEAAGAVSRRRQSKTIFRYVTDELFFIVVAFEDKPARFFFRDGNPIFK